MNDWSMPARVDDRGLQRIHAAALRLLSEVGCAVLDDEARSLLQSRGAMLDGRRVRMKEALIAEALSTAPTGYTVSGRRRECDLHLGPDAEAVLGSPSGPPFVLDEGLGEQRQGTLADLRVAIALAHVSPNIGVHCYSVEPYDVPSDRRARLSAHAHITGSDKVFRSTVTDPDELQVALDVCEILFGPGWHDVPRLWTNINTTSPLQLSGEAAHAIMRLARLGQPICLAACAMAGTTAPITLAGLLAVQHAELLAGLVLTQAARPGCPFLYGATSSVASMRSGALLMGAPQYWTLMEASVRLGHRSGLPVRAGGALTDAHVPDAQAGIESALAMETVLRLNVEFVQAAAGVLSSFNCFSPQKFVIDDEVLTALRESNRPLVVDDETLAFEVMAAVGPGSTLLAHAHTRRHAKGHERVTIMNRSTRDAWLAAGARDLADVAAARVADLLACYRPPDDLEPLVRRQLDGYCLR